MKGKLLAFASILCIASLMASGANAGKPDKPPGKPGETQTELISFTGDLVGLGEVEGCCPGQGPYPAYEMVLGFEVAGFPAGSHFVGVLYIEELGKGHDRKYQVDFWTEHHDGHAAIRVIGGEITKDKKNKTVTVVFTDADCVDIHGEALIAKVTFTLVRAPI